MDRKINVKKIHLQISNIITYSNEIIFEWSSDIGFGQYTIYKSGNKWYGDSECMDINEDKEFIIELMRLFVEQLEIRG